jgi:predicted ATPase
VAQIGAVLGRDFSYALLRSVGRVDDPALQSALDKLADADLLIAEGAGREATYRVKHTLIQDAAYDSLLKSRRQPLHHSAAEILRNDPERAAAEPEVIAHHFTQAGLDDLAIEWWGKAGDQALRRSAFQEAIAHLSRAIAMADKAGGAAAGTSGERRQLHVAYGNALLHARGYTAPETAEAFTRARDSAVGEKDAPERLAAEYGLWAGSHVRGELSPMRAHAETFLRDVEAKPDSPEVGVAHRLLGTTHWFAGEYAQARDHLERALALFQPGRDDDLAFRFGTDGGVAAMLYLAFALWPMGDVGRAVSLVGDAEARIGGLAHIGSRAFAKGNTATFELMRGDLSRAARNGVELARLAREHNLTFWQTRGGFLEVLATAQDDTASGELEAMRRGIELLHEQNAVLFDGLVKIALAEAEARAGDIDRALTVLDEALATSERIGHRAFDAELHRVRGEMLLRLDPANPALVEEALLTAIAVSKQQTTRSFELRAALSLAKLYQSTGRLAEAHGVLEPALEGFAPTPEMLEIAEAQTLLAALAETNEVNADADKQAQMRQLHIAYGNALIAVRGYGAPETTEAFTRVRASSADARDRLAAEYGVWAGSYIRCELPSMRAHVAAFLSDVEATQSAPEAGVAHRAAGVTDWFGGQYREARDHLERALALFQPGRDDDLAFRFGQDAGVSVMLWLALTLWPLGRVERAAFLVGEAQARIAGLTHVQTRMFGKLHAALFALMHGDFLQTDSNASELASLARESGLDFFSPQGVILEGWVKAQSGLPAEGHEDMRRGAELLREQNVRVFDGLYKATLAEAETHAGDIDRAVAILDEALATSERTGHRTFDAELHRVRGEMLLNRDPANLVSAEQAFQTAIAVAKHQGTRSVELRAVLPLAKLYQSTGRLADAHAVLAPALEGFAPMPEMPEIAEAQALLERLA